MQFYPLKNLTKAMHCEDNWTEIEDFAYARKDFFSRLPSLSDGIPSHDTFRRS